MDFNTTGFVRQKPTGHYLKSDVCNPCKLTPVLRLVPNITGLFGFINSPSYKKILYNLMIGRKLGLSLRNENLMIQSEFWIAVFSLQASLLHFIRGLEVGRKPEGFSGEKQGS